MDCMAASSLDILVYYHLVVADWHDELRARSQNILEFMRLAESIGVSFAFPSQSVYVESTPSEPLPPHEPRTLADYQADGGQPTVPRGRARPDGPEIQAVVDGPGSRHPRKRGRRVPGIGATSCWPSVGLFRSCGRSWPASDGRHP